MKFTFGLAILSSGLALVTRVLSFDYYYYTYGGCHVWAMADCWIPMYQHLDDLETSIVPTYTDEELTPICNSYDKVQRCVQEFIDECHPSIQNEFQSVNDSWHYLCVETKQEYLQHRACLDNEDLKAFGEEFCYNTFFEHLGELSGSNRDFSDILERQCHLVNNYLDCVENLIISYNCSVAAARWQRELDRRGLQPLLTDTGCVLDNSTGKTIYVYHSTSADHQTQDDEQHKPNSISKGTLIGCTVALCLIILAVGLLIVFKCMYNKKHHQQQQQRNSRHANQPAPPQNQWAVPPQAYGYGGGAVAFGVYNDPLPPKEDGKTDFATANPPEYSAEPGDAIYTAPPSHPPPYTGYPQNHRTTTSQQHSPPTAPDSSITDVE